MLKAAQGNERFTLIVARIKEHAARVLGTGPDQLDAERSLSEMGLDSLMAVELAEAVERDIGQPVSVMQMLSAGNIAAIADLVLKTLGLSGEPDVQSPEKAIGNKDRSGSNDAASTAGREIAVQTKS